MNIRLLKECKTVNQFNGFVEKLDPRLGTSGGRRFVHQKKFYTMNELVLQFHANAKSSNAQEIEIGLHRIKKLDDALNGKLKKLNPFQKLIHRIRKALGNWIFRMKYGRSREEFLQEIRDKFLKPTSRPPINVEPEPHHITSPHDVPTNDPTTVSTQEDEGRPTSEQQDQKEDDVNSPVNDSPPVTVSTQEDEEQPSEKQDPPVEEPVLLPSPKMGTPPPEAKFEFPAVAGLEDEEQPPEQPNPPVEEPVLLPSPKMGTPPPEAKFEFPAVAGLAVDLTRIELLAKMITEGNYRGNETFSADSVREAFKMFFVQELVVEMEKRYFPEGLPNTLSMADIRAFSIGIIALPVRFIDEKEASETVRKLLENGKIVLFATEEMTALNTKPYHTRLGEDIEFLKDISAQEPIEEVQPEDAPQPPQLENSLTLSKFERSAVMVDSPKEDLIPRIKSGKYDAAFLYQAQAVKEAFGEVYGPDAVESALGFYFLGKTPEVFDNLDLHALQMGIVANLTHGDVQFSLKRLKPSSQELIAELAQLRACPRCSQEELKGLSKKSYWYQLYKDLAFLEAVGTQVFDLTPDDKSFELKHLNYTEFLAHRLSYAIHKLDETQYRDGTLVSYSIYDREGHKTAVLMRACRLIGEPGLQATVLIPVDQALHGDAVPVQVLFRGSNENLAPWIRNFSPLEIVEGLGEGPGRKSFLNNKTKIMARFQELIGQIPADRPLKIEIFGHSLGATDTQRFCNALTEAVVENPAYQQRIKKINTYAFNPPGVELKTSKEFLDAAAKLPSVQFQLRYFKVAHDGVQQVASCLLGYKEEDQALPPNVLTTVFKFNWPEEDKYRGYLRNMLAAHMQYNLTHKAKAWLEDVRTNNPEDVNIQALGEKGKEPFIVVKNPRKANKALKNTLLRTTYTAVEAVA